MIYSRDTNSHVILTIDLEDWFHLLNNSRTLDPKNWGGFESRFDNNVERLLKVIDHHGVKATFFVLGWIADRYPEIIKKIASAGHQIGSHSYHHQLVFNQTPYDFEKDLVRSIAALENVSGQRVECYRAPGFSITEKCTWAFEILAKNGIRIDSSIFPARRSHGGFASSKIYEPGIIRTKFGDIYELPISAVRSFGASIIFSGGGYFRLLPWALINYLISSQSYTMTYFHPRDFDPDQPRISLPPLTKFKSYVGLVKSLNKFDLLLKHYDVVTCDAFEWTSKYSDNIWEI